ncbi:MAG: methyltransferase, partial [Vibrionaceae bacterium]
MQDFKGHFQRLDQYLSHYLPFWQYRPFEWQTLPWWQLSPQLCQWLSSLDLTQLAKLKESPLMLSEKVQRFLPEVANFTALCQVTQAPCNALEAP